LKIQLKRSNVLDGGKAKTPTPGQMEYGELAVNYNSTDPTIFIKDSSNNIVNLKYDDTVIQAKIVTIETEVDDIQDIVKVIPLPVDDLTPQPDTLDERYLLKTDAGSAPQNGQINVNAGTGIIATGNNATANQSGNTTRTLSLNTTYTDGRYVNVTGDTITGSLTVNNNLTSFGNLQSNSLKVIDLSGNNEDIVGVDNSGETKSFSVAALPERTTIVEDDWVLLEATNGTKYKQSVTNFAGTMKSIQSGSTPFDGRISKKETVTLSKAVDASKSFLVATVRGDTEFFNSFSLGDGASAAGYVGTASAKINSNGTSIEIEAGKSDFWINNSQLMTEFSQSGVVEWQVIEYY
jgi:hypothetical protein